MNQIVSRETLFSSIQSSNPLFFLVGCFRNLENQGHCQVFGWTIPRIYPPPSHASPDKKPIQNKPVVEGWTISFALLFVACWLRRESRFSTFCHKHSCCCCSTGKTWTWLSVWRQTSLFCQPPSRLPSGSSSDWRHAHLPHCSKDKFKWFFKFSNDPPVSGTLDAKCANVLYFKS